MRDVIFRVVVFSARELVSTDKVGRDPAIDFFKALYEWTKGRIEIYDLDEVKKDVKFRIEVVDVYSHESVSFDDEVDKCVLIEDEGKVFEFRIIPHKLIERSGDVVRVYFGLLEKYEEQTMRIDGQNRRTFEEFMKDELEGFELYSQMVNYLHPFIVYNGVMIFLPPRAVLTDIGGILDILRMIRIKSIKRAFSKVKAPLEVVAMMDSDPFRGAPTLSEYKNVMKDLDKKLSRRHPGIFMHLRTFLENNNAIYLGVHPYRRANCIVYGGITPLKYILATFNNELKKYPKLFDR